MEDQIRSQTMIQNAENLVTRVEQALQIVQEMAKQGSPVPEALSSILEIVQSTAHSLQAELRSAAEGPEKKGRQRS